MSAGGVGGSAASARTPGPCYLAGGLGVLSCWLWQPSWSE